MTKTPVDMPAEFAANPFGLKTLPDPSPGPESIPDPQPETNGELSMQSRWSGKTAQAVIGASAYSWLVLATAGACAVAMAGGAWLGTMGGHWVRVSGFLGMVALALGAGYFGYRVWAEYEMMYKPAQLRIGMGLLTLVVALLGLSLAEGARGITKLAGITVIVAALSTSVGTWLWAQCGALDLKYAAWSMLAAAFGIHALWGVVLLVAAPRIRI